MKNLRIGTRLSLGFAIVLMLLVALTVIGVWRMQSASAMTDEMIGVKVRNERLIGEWAKVIEVNAARTTTAWVLADPAEQKALAVHMPWVAEMKMLDNKATAYVCRDFACDAPSTDPSVFQ
jgi:methyl-accepting chemotaxis protein